MFFVDVITDGKVRELKIVDGNNDASSSLYGKGANWTAYSIAKFASYEEAKVYKNTVDQHLYSISLAK